MKRIETILFFFAAVVYALSGFSLAGSFGRLSSSWGFGLFSAGTAAILISFALDFSRSNRAIKDAERGAEREIEYRESGLLQQLSTLHEIEKRVDDFRAMAWRQEQSAGLNDLFDTELGTLLREIALGLFSRFVAISLMLPDRQATCLKMAYWCPEEGVWDTTFTIHFVTAGEENRLEVADGKGVAGFAYVSGRTLEIRPRMPFQYRRAHPEGIEIRWTAVYENIWRASDGGHHYGRLLCVPVLTERPQTPGEAVAIGVLSFEKTPDVPFEPLELFVAWLAANSIADFLGILDWHEKNLGTELRKQKAREFVADG